MIGGERKSATQLASMLDLVKKKKFASLEDIWDNEGLSKNEVKRRIKAIKRWEAEMAAPALAAIAAKDSVLRCIHFGSCSGCSAEVTSRLRCAIFETGILLDRLCCLRTRVRCDARS